VSVHSCFGTDSMTNADASTLCSTLGVNAAPTAMVDRFQHPGDDKPAHSRTVWQDRVNARSQIGSSAAIDLSGIYSWNRKVTLDVSVSFSDYELPGDIRLSLIVIEDSVSGTGSGWDQRNNLNTVSGHPMFGRGNPIVGYQHRHVLRKILPSTWGDNSVIPSNVVPNVSYDHTFVYNIPNKFKSKDMSFVAVVSYKGNASDEYEVINAKEIKMSELVVSSVSENSIEKSSFGFYPNPSADVSMIELELLENNNVEANLFDVTGKVVLSKNYLELQKGMNYLPIDVSSLANGFYFLKVKVGDEYLTKKVVVSHE
ncbi:MAG: Omp28-related outer membrane protein, partial [Vicingaceae bacterium]